MRNSLKPAATYLLNLAFALGIVGSMVLIGFQLSNVNPQLLAAIFTLIISSSAVLFTSITSNRELMIAADRSGNLIYLISTFTVPMSVSLFGLIMSILGFAFRAPPYLAQLERWFEWFLLTLSLWAALGFLSAILILFVIEFGTARKRSDNYKSETGSNEG